MEFIINNTLFTGKFLIHLPTVDSTNTYAKDYIAKSSPINGAVILADEQNAGRGQSGNVWISEANKNLTFSIVYHIPFLKATEQFYLNMAISLGVSSMLQKIGNASSHPVCIKWPNDIYVGHHKIAGILIENTILGSNLGYSIIGIGLNINQTNFPSGINATSLKRITGAEQDLNQALNQLLSCIESNFLLLKERKFEFLYNSYISQIYQFGVTATYQNEKSMFSGSIKGVDPLGNLQIETSEGIKSFGFKEVVFL